MSIPTVIMTCPVCGAQWPEPATRAYPGKRCHEDCKTRDERRLEEHYRMNPTPDGKPICCTVCSKAMIVYMQNRRQKYFYCSKACRESHLPWRAEQAKIRQQEKRKAARAEVGVKRGPKVHPRVEVACPECGATKTIKESQRKEQNFCSGPCASRYYSRTTERKQYPCQTEGCLGTTEGASRKFCVSCREARACVVEVPIKRRRKDQAIAYKGGQCQACGYNRCSWALQFHHIDESTKSFEISKKIARLSFEKLVPELDKCALLCANCHAEVHAGFLDLQSLR